MVWKILVVDDDPVIHQFFTIALKDKNFQDIPILLLHAFSKAEAVDILKNEKDIAVAFIDVVMETPNAGLELVDFTRKELNNREIRIILGTGYSKLINESQTIQEYDINYYYDKLKHDVKDPNELLGIIMLNLRNFRDIIAVKNSLYALSNIMEMRSALQKTSDYRQLFKFLLDQLMTFLSIKTESFHLEGLVALNNTIIATTPGYSNYLNLPMQNLPNFLTTDSKKTVSSDFKLSKNEKLSVMIFSEIDLSQIEHETILAYFSSLVTTLESSILLQNLNEQQVVLITKLAEMLAIRSSETAEHVTRVAEISEIIADKIGLQDIEKLNLAAKLHDIGKIGIPDNILNKPEKLTEEEYAIMKEHTVIGFNILKDIPLDVFSLSPVVALQHHERWDGKGYPYGLEGEQIDISAQIVSLVDVFEALTHDRIYRPGWSMQEAYEYIISNSGTQFSPEIVEIFRKSIKDIAQANFSIK